MTGRRARLSGHTVPSRNKDTAPVASPLGRSCPSEQSLGEGGSREALPGRFFSFHWRGDSVLLFPFCLFVSLSEILSRCLLGLVCFSVFPLRTDYAVLVASAVNFNYDAQLQGSPVKPRALLAVQTHVPGTDGGLQM